MQLNEVVSAGHQLREAFDDLKPLLVGLATCWAFLLIRVRAGSFSIMLERIWRLLGGAKSFNDPTYKEYWQQASDFEKFRYKTGIRFGSRAKIAQTMAWLKAHDVELEELMPVSRFFDPVNIDIKDPNLENRTRWGLTACVAGLLWTCIFATLTFYPLAMLTVRATHTNFVATPDYAGPVLSSDWALTRETCSTDQPGIAPADQKVICDLLNDEHRIKYMADAVEAQHTVAVVLIFSGVLMMYWVLFNFLKSLNAHRLYLRTRPQRYPIAASDSPITALPAS